MKDQNKDMISQNNEGDKNDNAHWSFRFIKRSSKVPPVVSSATTSSSLDSGSKIYSFVHPKVFYIFHIHCNYKSLLFYSTFKNVMNVLEHLTSPIWEDNT